MYSSHIYGFGFEPEYHFFKFQEFLRNHREAFCKSEEEKALYEEFQGLNSCDVEEFFGTYIGDINEMEGAGSVIANIMYRETGVRFIYCLRDSDCDTPDAVLFTEKYPWNLTERERSLTAEETENICKKYMAELGINGTPQYLALEYMS